MAADLTSLSNVLKEFYLTPLADQMNQDVMVTSLLDVTAENLEGLKAVLPLHYGRSSGISSRPKVTLEPAIWEWMSTPPAITTLPARS